MMTMASTVPSPTPPKQLPSWGWQPKDEPRNDHPRVWVYFAVCSAALVAAAIAVPLLVHDGPMLWPLAMLGAVIIVALLSAAAVPHLRQH